jgi:hypothetical protein
MSFPNYKYGTGLSNAGSYQASGKPFVSGGLDASETMSVEFPSVSRWIYVVNNTADVCRVGFSELGVDGAGTNYFTVHSGSTSDRLEVKVSQVWLSGSGDVDVFAGLTGISPDRITNVSPSGSNWSGSAGIG